LIDPPARSYLQIGQEQLLDARRTFTVPPTKSEVRDAFEQFIIRKGADDPSYRLAKASEIEDMAILTIDVMNLHFSDIGLPLALRGLVIAIIGASSHARKDDEGWFPLGDKDLAVRVIDDKATKGNTLQVRIRRARKKLDEWQTLHELQLVEIRPGGGKVEKDDRGRVVTNDRGQIYLLGVPTHYRLPIVDAMLEVVHDYQVFPHRTADTLKRLVKGMQRKLGLLKRPEPPEVDKICQQRRAKLRAVSQVRRYLDLSDDRAEALDEIIDEIKLIDVEIDSDYFM
jgi:hypothetical protein